MSKKSNKIEIDILSDISDIQEGHNQVIPIVTENEDELSENYSIPESLPILSLRSSVLFPGSITPITVGREKSMKLIRDVEAGTGILGAVLQKESDVEQPAPDDMYRIGTAARILKTLDMPNGNLTVILHGLEKIEINEYLSSEPYFTATVTPLKDTTPASGNVEFEALVESIKDVALNIISVSPNIPKEASFAIKNIDSKRGIINFICSNLDFEDADRQRLLEAPGLLARARRLLEILVREQQLVELKNKIQSKVKQDIDQQQKEYYLQQQIRTIQEELGGNEDEAEIARMREEAKTKKWSKEVGEMFNKELNKLERLNPAVAEYSVQMNYLQLMLELPWGECTQDNLDLKHACERLDNDHFGLEEVKERLLEHLAVIKLKGDLKSPIICLYGPPGVGKTSLGKSVAGALGRKFGRISLGGLHDESEIRGHRRTYIGAMPGRIIQTIKRCGSSNPVIILDEVDKIGVGNHGDPSSALLEVLDPEQNTTFHDNYLDTEYDLSKTLFIATANNIQNVHPALRDRMEMINIPGYLLEEKIANRTAPSAPQGTRGARHPRREPAPVARSDGADYLRLHPRSRGARTGQDAGQNRTSPGKRYRIRAGVQPGDIGRRFGKDTRHAQVPQRKVRSERHHGRSYRPGMDRSGRRYPLHRVDTQPRQGQTEPDGQPRRRDEGVGDDSPRMDESPLCGAGNRQGEVREFRHQHPRTGGSHPEGRPERRHHHGDVAGIDLHRPEGERPHRHDG